MNRIVDVDKTAEYFVRAFRTGKLGQFNLDIEDVRNFAAGSAGEDAGHESNKIPR